VPTPTFGECVPVFEDSFAGPTIFRFLLLVEAVVTLIAHREAARASGRRVGRGGEASCNASLGLQCLGRRLHGESGGGEETWGKQWPQKMSASVTSTVVTIVCTPSALGEFSELGPMSGSVRRSRHFDTWISLHKLAKTFRP
jgi:hypothetical protein